ncbi:MAG TPA: serine hydrolase [Planctomycetota bacterium]|nr:serine hydrolase [Planctomycetota bacterium]HPF15567.1 serine hydrolase [Planctomycetota bacterium]HRV79907.1 serine hydrolase [Planctomycetota bacterium]
MKHLLACVGLWLATGLGLGVGFGQDPEAPAPKPIRIACVGDSITRGANAPGRDWPAQLAERVERFAPGEYLVENFGHGGATLLEGPRIPYRDQSEYPASLEFLPDIVIINLGVNDSNHGFWDGNAEKFRASMLELVGVYQGLASHPTVYLSTLTTMNAAAVDFARTLEFRATVDRVVRNIAAESGLQVVEFGEVTKNIPEWVPDGLHPNGDGYNLMAAEAFEVLFRDRLRARRGALVGELLAGAHEQGAFFGNALVAERGHVLFEGSFGLADDASKRPLDANSVFELASVSKPITAILVLRLVQAGTLGLDDLVTKHWPEFPYPAITLRQLLTHTSGLIVAEEFFAANLELKDPNRPLSNDQVCSLLVEQKPALQSEPGQAFAYNNLGYIVLAKVVSQVTHKSFAEALRSEVFAPTGLTGGWISSETPTPEQAANLVKAYVQSTDGGWIHDLTAPGWEFLGWLGSLEGDGGVRLSARDLLRLDMKIWGPTSPLLSESSQQSMLEPVVLADGTRSFDRGWTPAGYGLGWWLAEDGTSAWHTGDWGGSLAYYRHWHPSGRTVILLQNRRSNDWSWMADLEAILTAEIPGE